MSFNPDAPRNLKRIELDEFGKIWTIEFHDCPLPLNKEGAEALRTFIEHFNQKPVPTMKANGVQSHE